MTTDLASKQQITEHKSQCMSLLLYIIAVTIIIIIKRAFLFHVYAGRHNVGITRPGLPTFNPRNSIVNSRHSNLANYKLQITNYTTTFFFKKKKKASACILPRSVLMAMLTDTRSTSLTLSCLSIALVLPVCPTRPKGCLLSFRAFWRTTWALITLFRDRMQATGYARLLAKPGAASVWVEYCMSTSSVSLPEEGAISLCCWLVTPIPDHVCFPGRRAWFESWLIH